VSYVIIKRNYDRGLWSAEMVKIAADKDVITLEEYVEITGMEYMETDE
jgi:hypothetical protein